MSISTQNLIARPKSIVTQIMIATHFVDSDTLCRFEHTLLNTKQRAWSIYIKIYIPLYIYIYINMNTLQLSRLKYIALRETVGPMSTVHALKARAPSSVSLTNQCLCCWVCALTNNDDQEVG
jgi:hypothetical protein